MYGSPPSAARDLNLQFPPPPGPFSHPKEETDHHQNHHHHQQQQQQQMSSGLLRYRSAPSTLFGEEDFVPVRPSSPDADTIFARFLAPELRNEIHEKPGGRGGEGQGSPQFLPPAPAAMEQKGAQQDNEFPSPSQMLYHSQQQPSSGGNYSNLIRHSSSPAGLFSHLNVENGYGMMRGLDGFRNGNVSPGIQAANRLKGQISFSARQASAAAGMMPQISEMGAESSPEESSLGSGGNPGGGGRGYIPGFPVTTWDDSPLISDGFSGAKRSRDAVDGKLVHGLNQPGSQTPELRSSLSGLSSSDMASIEKFLQFQDSVPCKIRAKRGCATHPRSIAERVRRTRISERMRKLQELVPNMDKQTNTADMLDLAVEHIKDLQRQVKGLSDGRASCTCSSSKQKPYLKQGM